MDFQILRMLNKIVKEKICIGFGAKILVHIFYYYRLDSSIY